MKLFLVDGSALLYRSHFAFRNRPLATSQGETTSAAFGFTNALLRLREEEGGDLIVVAFDVKGKTFRHDLFPDYKAQRPPMPDELRSQLDRVKQVVRSMGVPLLEQAGVEADDILGTLARTGLAAGHDVWIYSGDKDFIPLVKAGVGILKPAGRGGQDEYLDETKIEAKLGILPPQYLDVLTLMGDKVDNIPGVPGIGEKTALKLIGEFESLDQLMEQRKDKRVSPRQRRLLEEHADQFAQSRELLTIREDLELDFDWNELESASLITPDFLALCQELEFYQLLERLGPAASRSQTPAVEAVVVSPDTPDPLAALHASPRGYVEVIAHGPDPMRAELRALVLAGEEGDALCFPLAAPAAAEAPDLFAAPEATGWDWSSLADVVKPWLADPSIPKVGHNLKFTQMVLAEADVPVQGAEFDTMIASHLVASERRQHELDALAADVLGRSPMSLAEVLEGVDSKDPGDAAPDRLAAYGASRMEAMRELRAIFRDQLEADDLTALLVELEMPLSQVLLRMEQRGVRLDVKFLRKLSAELTAQLAQTQARIYELAGEEFNLNSPKQLQHILFERLGLKPTKKTRTGYSTDVDVLTKLADEHELPGLLLEFREASKLLSTYVDALPDLVHPRTGCIHTSYSQAVAATGRLSSANPNLQNIPIRTDAGRRIRRAFVPKEKGWRLLAADYSQIELRLMAHFSGDENLQQAFRDGEDIHARTAALVNGVELDAVTAAMRGNAKAINFGILYGMGARALAQNIGVKPKEAQGFIDEYFAQLPKVRNFIDTTIEEARHALEVRTILGRRRRLPELTANDPRTKSFGERIAVNTPIQGSAADLIKLAMIRIEPRLEAAGLNARLLLQVHDELILELPQDEVEATEELVRDVMENVFDLDVPLRVEVSSGKHWEEAHA